MKQIINKFLCWFWGHKYRKFSKDVYKEFDYFRYCTRCNNIKQTIMIDRTNKTWNNEISDEDILNREITIAYLIQTNQHLDLFKQLKEMVLSTYRVVAEFECLGYNGESIWCNNQKLVYRRRNYENFKVGNNVTILEHNITSKGGSNKYPRISYLGAKVKLDFISYGLPFVDKTNGWSIKVIDITKQ